MCIFDIYLIEQNKYQICQKINTKNEPVRKNGVGVGGQKNFKNIFFLGRF